MTTDQTNVSEQGAGEPGGEPVRDSASEQIAEINRLREQMNQAYGDYQRVLADFSNYQRRALTNEQVAKIDGSSRVVSDIVTVIDHFDLALTQDPAKATAQSILEGMKMVRDELLRTLARHGVQTLAPRPNDEFQPGRHEAVMQSVVEGVEPGRVASMLQPGYAINGPSGERVIRPAKVAVAP